MKQKNALLTCDRVDVFLAAPTLDRESVQCPAKTGKSERFCGRHNRGRAISSAKSDAEHFLSSAFHKPSTKA
mgnify:CR=1 FL=1